MTMNRRDLLKGAAVVGVSAVAGTAPASAGEPASPPEDGVGMLYDATLCIGCRVCVTACKKANDLPYNLSDPAKELSGDTKNIIRLYAEGDERSYIKAQCNHCIDPACATACMIGAMAKREMGIVTWDPEKCIGCRYCQVACPFNIPKFEWGKPNPKIVKCELCKHRLDEGKEPGCCEACPVGAVIFGKYEDLLKEARQRIEQHKDRYWPKGDPRIFGEADLGGTQVLYLADVSFDKLGLPDIGNDPVPKLARSVQHGAYKWGIGPLALYGILGAVMWHNRRGAAAEEEK